jgi:hypothetical protein
LRRMYHRLKKSFWMHPKVLLGDGLKWMLDSVCLEIVSVLMQDRCTVCAERSTGSKIVLDVSDRTTR